MNEIKVQDKIYLEKYDVNVNPYLTYAQIQQIANAVVSLSQVDAEGKTHDSWAERKQCIDMLMLYYATDIGREKLDELGHEVCLCSGLIDGVSFNIRNYFDISEAIEYQESEKQAIKQIINQLPEALKPLEKVVRKYGNKADEQSRA